jgi:hypothetical protein
MVQWRVKDAEQSHNPAAYEQHHGQSSSGTFLYKNRFGS